MSSKMLGDKLEELEVAAAVAAVVAGSAVGQRRARRGKTWLLEA